MAVSNNNLFYLNSQGIVENEVYAKDLISSAKRWLCQISGYKNYQLDSVISKLFQELDTSSVTSTQEDFDHLCTKLAKKCKIDTRITDLLFKANKELQRSTKAHKSLDILCPDLSNKETRQNVEKFQKLLPKDAIFTQNLDTVLKRAQAKQRWTELGLSEDLFNKDPIGASFLIKQRIIYSIVGFQQTTSAGSARHQILWDSKQNSLTIKVEGRYLPVSSLQDFQYSNDEVQLINKKDQSRWNYFSPNGLQPIDRYKGDLQPVEELPKSDFQALQANACKFTFPDKSKKDSTTHPCVLQIYTNPRKQFNNQSGFLDRLESNIPLHTGMVLIKDGKVYSTGLGRTPEEMKLGESGMGVTVAGMPTSFDFETFRAHEGRIVTSIPLTTEKFDEIMNDLNDMRKKTIRYNMLKQNCCDLAAHMMDKAGVPVHHKVDQYVFLSGILPAVKDIPVIGWVAKKLKHISKAIETETGIPSMETTALHTWNVTRYLMTKLNYGMNFFINLVMKIGFGSAKGSPVKEGCYEGGKFTAMSTLLPDFKSMFSHEPSMIHHSRPIIRWQLEQTSTVVHPYDKPSMSIVPPTDTETLEKEKELKKKFLEKYQKGLFCTVTAENNHLAEVVH